MAWAPQACTLPTAALSLRVAEWDALFSERLTSVSRPQPLRLRLDLAGGPGVEERIRDLVVRETECCSFFTFTFTTASGGDRIRLDISVDQPHEAVLDVLAARSLAGGER